MTSRLHGDVRLETSAGSMSGERIVSSRRKAVEPTATVPFKIRLVTTNISCPVVWIR